MGRDVVIHVDQGEQLARSRAPRVLRRGRRQIGRKRTALVVLNDADDHRSGVAANHRLPSALDMEEVSSGLEDLVRHSVEASPQVGPKALASTWTDHADVPEADPLDHAERVMFGLGQHCVSTANRSCSAKSSKRV